MEDLVSVIIPVFNSSKTLAQSIDSILVQSYSNFEILIVDDFSVDLPRPRDIDMVAEPAYIKTRKSCLDIIRVESRRAFEQQNQ